MRSATGRKGTHRDLTHTHTHTQTHIHARAQRAKRIKENIPVGCVPPALWFRGKSISCPMSFLRDRYSGSRVHPPTPEETWNQGPGNDPAPEIPYPPPPPHPWTDKQLRKHYLPATSLAVGNSTARFNQTTNVSGSVCL